jgi:hypothetical protein
MTEPAVEELAREYADKMVPRELPVNPLQHVVGRDEFRDIHARGFIAGFATAVARAADVCRKCKEDARGHIGPLQTMGLRQMADYLESEIRKLAG